MRKDLNEDFTKQNTINDKAVLELMAEYFLHGQEAQCLLCDNYMKNIKITKDESVQGCDGNCSWNKKYDKYDLIKIFEEEIQRRG